MEKIHELYKKYREIIVYVIVGGLTTIVSWLAYFICVVTFLDARNPVQLQIANIISWIAGVAFGYVTNRKYVFLSHDPHIAKEAARFTAARISTLLLDMFVMWLLVSVLGWNDKLSKIISTIFVMIGNYVFSKLLVFRKKSAG